MSIWVNGQDFNYLASHTGVAQLIDIDTALNTNTTPKKNKTTKKKKSKASSDFRALDVSQKIFYYTGGVLFACGAGVLIKTAWTSAAVSNPAPTVRSNYVPVQPPLPSSPAPLTAANLPAQEAEAIADTDRHKQAADIALSDDVGKTSAPRIRQAAHKITPVARPVKSVPAHKAAQQTRPITSPPPPTHTTGLRSIGVVIDPDADARLYQRHGTAMPPAAIPQPQQPTALAFNQGGGAGDGQMKMTVNRGILRQQQEQARQAAALTAADTAEQPPPAAPPLHSNSAVQGE